MDYDLAFFAYADAGADAGDVLEGEVDAGVARDMGLRRKG